MIAENSMRFRLERGKPVTLRDFSDIALRIFDFLGLARREGCLLQLGGSEQWGGILDGIELAHQIDRRQLFGLSTPLPSTGAGLRIGGVPAEDIGLDPMRLDPSAFRQCWRASRDADVPRFLRLFTELPLETVAQLTGPGSPGLDAAKAVLADEITRLVHGDEAASEHKTGRRNAVERDAERLPSGALWGNSGAQSHRTVGPG
jgi:tyrosyl-tRNA synthetase